LSCPACHWIHTDPTAALRCAGAKPVIVPGGTPCSVCRRKGVPGETSYKERRYVCALCWFSFSQPGKPGTLPDIVPNTPSGTPRGAISGDLLLPYAPPGKRVRETALDRSNFESTALRQKRPRDAQAWRRALGGLPRLTETERRKRNRDRQRKYRIQVKASNQNVSVSGSPEVRLPAA